MPFPRGQVRKFVRWRKRGKSPQGEKREGERKEWTLSYRGKICLLRRSSFERIWRHFLLIVIIAGRPHLTYSEKKLSFICEFDFDNGSSCVGERSWENFRWDWVVAWVPIKGRRMGAAKAEEKQPEGPANKPGRKEKTKTSRDPFGFFPQMRN